MTKNINVSKNYFFEILGIPEERIDLVLIEWTTGEEDKVGVVITGSGGGVTGTTTASFK